MLVITNQSLHGQIIPMVSAISSRPLSSFPFGPPSCGVRTPIKKKIRGPGARKPKLFTLQRAVESERAACETAFADTLPGHEVSFWHLPSSLPRCYVSTPLCSAARTAQRSFQGFVSLTSLGTGPRHAGARTHCGVAYPPESFCTEHHNPVRNATDGFHRQPLYTCLFVSFFLGIHLMPSF